MVDIVCKRVSREYWLQNKHCWHRVPAPFFPISLRYQLDLITDWLRDQTQGCYYWHFAANFLVNDIWFENPQDAMLFQLTWG